MSSSVMADASSSFRMSVASLELTWNTMRHPRLARIVSRILPLSLISFSLSRLCVAMIRLPPYLFSSASNVVEADSGQRLHFVNHHDNGIAFARFLVALLTQDKLGKVQYA